jgi:hypothetical protein
MSKSQKMTDFPLPEEIVLQTAAMQPIEVFEFTDLPCELFLEVLKNISRIAKLGEVCKLFRARIMLCKPALKVHYVLNTVKFNKADIRRNMGLTQNMHTVIPEIELHCKLYRVTSMQLSGLNHSCFMFSIGDFLGRHAKHLTNLDIQGSAIHTVWLAGLTRLRGLTALNLSRNEFIGRTPGAQRKLELPVNLQSLEMRDCEIRGLDDRLATACPGLTSLDLSDNLFGGQLAGRLSEVVALLPKLQTLKLRNCRLRGAAVATVVTHAPISLTHLDLVHNTLRGDTQDESSIPFYTRLAKLTALTDLALPQHHSVYIAIESTYLADTLCALPLLTALDFSPGSLDFLVIQELRDRGVTVVS